MNNRKTSLAVLYAALFLAGPLASAAPILNIDHPAAIRNEYIVVLNEPAVAAQNVVDLAEEFAASYALTVQHHYETALSGLAVTASPEAVRVLAADARVKHIEANIAITLERVPESIAPAFTMPVNTWALDLIDQRTNDGDLEYTIAYNGSTVHAYVVDSGIWPVTEEFGDRLSGGVDFVNDGEGTDGCYANSHGTMMASLLGGQTYGVAKLVQLHPVRIVNCTRATDSVKLIAALDWIAAHRILPAIANVSLGGNGSSDAIDAAVSGAIERGVVVVAAAGNSNQNACNVFPANAPGTYAVGAMDILFRKADFSNYGSCVDIYAPGVSVPAMANTGLSSSAHGTSQAAAIVSGVMALYLTPTYRDRSPGAAMQFVSATATRYALSGVGSTHDSNKIVYSLLDAPERLDDDVTYMPRNVRVNNERCRGFNTVSWDAPSSGSSVNAEYSVYVSDYKDFRTETLHVVTTLRSATVTAPFNGARYVRVRARQQGREDSYPMPGETPATYFNGCL